MYSLSGADERLFYIASNAVTEDDPDTTHYDVAAAGQIRVAALTELDHEVGPEHSVRVTATDTYNATGSTGVTITIVDVDEAPVISAPSDGAPAPANNAPKFPATEDGARSVAENTAAGEDIGAPVAATDADTTR